MPRRLFLALLSLLYSFSLVSCIEGEEEIWLNADASGRIKFKGSFPLIALAQAGDLNKLVEQAKLADQNNDNIEIDHFRTHISGNKFHLEIELSFKNALKLEQALIDCRDPATPEKKSIPEVLIGKIDVQVRFPNLTYQRKIDPSSLIPKEATGPLTQNLLGDSKLTYILHLPEPVKAHNADFLSPDRRTLKWQIPVSALIAEPVEMNFESTVPNSTRYLFILIGLLSLPILAIFIWFRFRKKKHERT